MIIHWTLVLTTRKFQTIIIAVAIRTVPSLAFFLLFICQEVKILS